MISGFRAFARSKFAIVLLVVLGVSLVVTGAQMDVFGAFGSRNVISAGSRSLDGPEFASQMDRVRNNLQEEAGRPVTLQEMVAENIHLRFLEQETQKLGFLAWAWNAGIRPGAALVAKEIRGIPAFFNQVTGQFDQTQYEQLLAERGLTPEALEREFRDQYMVNHYGEGLSANVRIPAVYGALLAARALESRDARWFTVTQAMVGTTPPPTDAQLTAFINENAEQLRLPEFRTVSLVVFNSPEAPVAPTEARIQERFEFRQAALSQPETRTFTTFTTPTREAAVRVAAALRDGRTSVEAARAGGVQPADFSATPRSAVSDPAVAQLVFGLPPGQVSDPVQGRVGFTVARVQSVTPARPATLESARAAIVEELQAEDQRAAIYRRVEAYEAARNQGADLTRAVQASSARILVLPPFTAEGRLPNGQTLPAPEQVVTAAFATARGAESEVIDAGQGQYFALRVDAVRPAAVPPLAEIREPLSAQWTQRQNALRLANRGEALAAQVRNGQDIAAVAAAAGAPLTVRTNLIQNQPTAEALGQAVTAGVFGQGRGQVFATAGADGFVVGRVDAVRAPAAAEAAALSRQLAPRLPQAVVGDLVPYALAQGAVRVDATSDAEAALAALGVSPTAAPGSGAPGSGAQGSGVPGSTPAR